MYTHENNKLKQYFHSNIPDNGQDDLREVVSSVVDKYQAQPDNILEKWKITQNLPFNFTKTSVFRMEDRHKRVNPESRPVSISNLKSVKALGMYD